MGLYPWLFAFTGPINKHTTMSSHKTTKQEILFRVADLGVAAALMCFGFELQSIDNANTQKQTFLFEFEKGIDDLAQDHWRDDEDDEQLVLPTQHYFEALMELQHKLRGEEIIH